MTNDLTRPEPLVPAEVTMGNNDWFPLHFRRMRKSRWWRVSSDMARSRSIDLWGYAYEEQPAGSLPNDDVELADFAGFGRDVTAWLKAKDEIMAAWVLCSDGRYYHPTLCEVILEAWEKGSVKRKTEAQRKAEYRARVRQNQQVSRGTPPKVSRDKHDVSHGTVLENHGTVPVEERRGQDRTGNVAPNGAVDAEATTGGEDDNLPLVLDADTRTDVEKLRDRWNQMVDYVNPLQPEELKLAKVAKMDGARLKAVKSRLKDYGLTEMLKAVETVAFSRFLRGGENDRGRTWRADFDFLMQAKSCRKVIEGVWPRNMDPSKELIDGAGTGSGGREAQHSERVRDSWSAAMDGLDSDDGQFD